MCLNRSVKSNQRTYRYEYYLIRMKYMFTYNLGNRRSFMKKHFCKYLSKIRYMLWVLNKKWDGFPYIERVTQVDMHVNHDFVINKLVKAE